MSGTQYKSKKEGFIQIADEPLAYAILENYTIVIPENALYFYLEMSDANKEFVSYPTKDNELIAYTSVSGQLEIGIPIGQIPAYSLTLCEISSEKKNEVYFKACKLIIVLAGVGLAQLIYEENTKSDTEQITPSFDVLLGGLLKVPPYKNKKKK